MSTELDYGEMLRSSFKASIRRDNPLILLTAGALLVFGTAVTGGILVGPLAVSLAWVGLRAARGQSLRWEDLRHGFDRFVPAFVAGLGYLLAVVVGSLLLVVPGVVAAFVLSLAFLIVADTSSTGVDALTSAVRMVRERPGPVAVWAVLVALLVAVASLVPVLGSVVGAGIAAVFTGQFYRLWRKQPEVVAA
ncbi:MAG: hypothetical protein ACFB9M_08240 [Myxococcota bacterium]